MRKGILGMHDPSKPKRRAAILLAALLGLSGLWTGAAWAASLKASTTGTETVSTGDWEVVASTAASNPTHAALSLAVPATGSFAYFQLFNTGTVALAGYTITTKGASCSTACTLTLMACSVAWNQTANTCSGTKTTIVNAATLNGTVVTNTVSTAAAVPVNPNAIIYVQAEKTQTGADTVAVNTSVASAPTRQIRALVHNNA
jgi:hypothetical protein